jgi:carbonic anhydrase
MLPEGLRSGYARFQSQRFARDCQKYRALATHGNHPGTLVISCCDSRATPEVIFDTDPGEMLVMRNIANIVPPFELGGQYHGTSAVLDFAVRRLEVRHILVLGHSDCGGVRAFAEDVNGISNGEFIGPWLNLIGKTAHECRAAGRGCEHDLQSIEFQSIRNSLHNLLTFPWIASRVSNRALCLHGVHFDVGSGTLRVYNEVSDEFEINTPNLPVDGSTECLADMAYIFGG